MAAPGKKITALDPLSAITSDDLFVVVNNPDGAITTTRKAPTSVLDDRYLLAFGEIFVAGNTVETAISSSGKANRVQITAFDTNSESRNATPDHASNHITVTQAGVYMIAVCIHADSPAGGGAVTFGWSIYKNNGATEIPNLHAHRGFSGGGAEAGSSNVCGMAHFDVDDTIELWCWNEDDTQNVVNEDVGISITQVG